MATFLGEYTQNSLVLLELLIKGDDEQPILPDDAPTVAIETFMAGGLHEIYSDILQSIENGRYYVLYDVPNSAILGDYVVTYRCTIKGIDFVAKERFRVTDALSLLMKVYQVSNDIQLDLGNPSIEKTNVYSSIKALSLQLDTFKQSLDPKPVLVEVNNYTLLTNDGFNTTVLINNRPLAGVKVQAYSDLQPTVLAGRGITNEKGEWSISLYKGSYRFDFIHPNGSILKQVRKAV